VYLEFKRHKKFEKRKETNNLNFNCIESLFMASLRRELGVSPKYLKRDANNYDGKTHASNFL